MNDIQIIQLVIQGLHASGWKIYGDKFIGFRAFKEIDGSIKEFDFNLIYDHQGPEQNEACDVLNDTCNGLKSGDYQDCKYWEDAEVSY